MTKAPESSRPPHTSAATVERGRLRREEIVAAAMELFAVEGYRGTSLARIAARVGVTQAGLLHHFGSKEKLLQSVMERVTAQNYEVANRVLAGGSSDSVDWLPKLAEFNSGRAGIIQLNTKLVAENLDTDQPLHEHFVQRYRSTRASIADAIRASQERGDARADLDADALAARIVATIEGLQMQWLLDPERVDLVESHRELAAVLRRELRPDEPPE